MQCMYDGRNFDLKLMGTRILRTSSLEENPSAFYLSCSIDQFVRNLKTLRVTWNYIQYVFLSKYFLSAYKLQSMGFALIAQLLIGFNQSGQKWGSLIVHNNTKTSEKNQ